MKPPSSGGGVFMLPESKGPEIGSCDMLLLLGDADVWVEVKAKQDHPSDYATWKVLNILKAARRQIPASDPCLLYLHLPPAWGHDADALLNAEATARRWLRGTGRVNAVVVLLEHRLPLPAEVARASSSTSPR